MLDLRLGIKDIRKLHIQKRDKERTNNGLMALSKMVAFLHSRRRKKK